MVITLFFDTQGLQLCRQTGTTDKAILVDGSCMDILMDAATMLADVAMFKFGNNMSSARCWLLVQFGNNIIKQTSTSLDSISLVPVNMVEWCFSEGVSGHLCVNGITEKLTDEATRDATQMYTWVKHINAAYSPGSPAVPRVNSPTLGLELTPKRLQEMLGSPRMVSLDELLG